MIDESRHNDSSDEDAEDTWDLITCATVAIVDYYCKFLLKEPCMISDETGHKWMQEILSMNDIRCKIMFRMEKDTFFNICSDLENFYHLKPSTRMTVAEKVGIFVFILAQGASNRHAQKRFKELVELFMK
ncbi:hypothetical protein M5689_021101 [Euphorbia peplus]|nr:hypothetical protein M5689_021101 [Euphorbia peplus]